MTPHLLPLSALHAAAPGVLDVIFGPDGDFEGAPCAPLPVFAKDQWWTIAAFTATEGKIGGALLVSADGQWPPVYESVPLSWCDLDLRIPTVAARLAGLCERAADSETYRNNTALLISAFRASAGAWFDDEAARLAALTLALAPRITALGGTR